MNVITPATKISTESLLFQVNGEVVRVFDQNSHGELMPVEYTQLADHNKFTLRQLNFGQVYAEVKR